jgi:hypothetical protein
MAIADCVTGDGSPKARWISGIASATSSAIRSALGHSFAGLFLALVLVPPRRLDEQSLGTRGDLAEPQRGRFHALASPLCPFEAVLAALTRETAGDGQAAADRTANDCD